MENSRAARILSKVAKALTPEQQRGNDEALSAAVKATPQVWADNISNNARRAGYPQVMPAQVLDMTQARWAQNPPTVGSRNRSADLTQPGVQAEEVTGSRSARPVDPTPAKKAPTGNMADPSFRSTLSMAQGLRGPDGQKLHGAELVKAFQDRMKARDQTAQSPKPEYRSPSGVAIENPFGGAAAAAPRQLKTPPAVGHVMPGRPAEAPPKPAGAGQAQIDLFRTSGKATAAIGQAAQPAQNALLQSAAPVPATPVPTRVAPAPAQKSAPVAAPPRVPAPTTQVAARPTMRQSPLPQFGG